MKMENYSVFQYGFFDLFSNELYKLNEKNIENKLWYELYKYFNYNQMTDDFKTDFNDFLNNIEQ
jgi:hypothetical protein